MYFRKQNFNMLYFSPAKINLGLFVTGKREDGYHNLESLFLPIALYDAVELTPADKNEITIYGAEIPGDSSKNSCLLSLELMQREFGVSQYHISLLKKNPMGAGLGGGSANSAAVIQIINQLEQLNLSTEEMQNLALQIGSDNAFFIEQRPKYVTGRGENLQDCKVRLSGHKVVLIIPPVHQSTKEAYADVHFSKPTIELAELTDEQVVQKEVQLKNSFQESFLHRFPETEQILQSLEKNGSYYSSLTGSGAAFYGLFLPSQNIPEQLKHFAGNNGYRYIETKIL